MNVWRERIKPALKSPVFWKNLALPLTVLATALIVRDATAASALAAGEILRALAALAWPALFLAAGWYYRREVRVLISRLKKASATSVELSDVVSAQATLQPIAEALKDVDPNAARDSLMSVVAVRIRQALDSLEPDNHERRETRLTVDLAGSHVTLHFLRTHLTIFLSQMEALERSRQINGKIALLPFYQSHEVRYESAKSRKPEIAPLISFESWRTFLVTHRLMSVGDVFGEITDEGAKFVDYISSQNFPRIYSF